MHIITSGSSYLDIDAYAGIIAYAELLQLQGEAAQAVSTAPLNESISATIRSWKMPLQTSYTANSEDTFTLIDVSEKEFFDPIVDLARVEAIIDHHPGFEAYWHDRIGAKTNIEFIGAACTLVYEQWVAAGMIHNITGTSAKLLVSGILDNTLNFKARVTTDRDRAAYETLMAQAHIPETWVEHYFSECQTAILTDAATAIQNDAKTITFKTFPHTLTVGQLVVWDSDVVLGSYMPTVADQLSTHGPNWFMNIVGIHDGCSSFIAHDPAVQAWLSKLLSVEFEGHMARANRMWLRKEIIKADLLA